MVRNKKEFVENFRNGREGEGEREGGREDIERSDEEEDKKSVLKNELRRVREKQKCEERERDAK